MLRNRKNKCDEPPDGSAAEETDTELVPLIEEPAQSQTELTVGGANMTPFDFNRVEVILQTHVPWWKPHIDKMLENLRAVMNNLREEMLIDMRYDWTSPKTKCLVVGFDDWNVRIYYKALDAIHISKCIQQYITGIVNDWGFDAEFPCMGAIRAWTAGPYCVCSTQFGNDPKRMHLIVLNIIPKPPIYKMTGKIDMRAVVKFDHGPNEKPKIKFQCMN